MLLRKWQELFQQSILQPGRYDGIFLDLLQPGSTSRQAQLDIYRNAYLIRLIEALRSNYPMLHQLLGDRDFSSMGRDYLELHPPAHSSIRWFGNLLAIFLEQRAPYADLPVFSELARFEWALRHTIDAADVQIVTTETLQGISPERWGELQFVLHPSASVMALQWNTPQIWQALTSEQTPPAPETAPMSWIVYRRPDLIGCWRSVTDLELKALDCLSGGGRFADICEVVAGLVPEDDESALRSAELLRLWVDHGLISIREA